MSGWAALGLGGAALLGGLAGAALQAHLGGPALRRAAAALIAYAETLGFAPSGSVRPQEAGLDLERFRLWLQGEWARSEAERGRLSEVLAGLTEGLLLVGAGGEVLLCNDVAAGLWPRLRQALGGRGLGLAAEPALEGALRAAFQSGELQRADIERPGPPRRSYRLRVLPLPAERADGGRREAPAALVVVQDITEHRAAEQMRRDFVANVSHELQTPLTSVRGYAETLRDLELSPEEHTRFADRILTEAERMAALVRDLLALAQIEAPRWVGSEPVRLGELAQETAAALAAFARERGVELVVEEGEAVVEGRPDELRRALENLVRNGLAYTPAGGRVTVRALRRGSEAIVEVEDTGVGIPAEALGRIFERFYRVDRGRSRDTGGTGLGLAIVKHTAEGHHGHVDVRSEPGRGSTFTLVLPARAGRAAR